MSDHDRLLSSITAQGAGRVLADGCTGCGFSVVYCNCVTYIEGGAARCCPACQHPKP